MAFDFSLVVQFTIAFMMLTIGTFFDLYRRQTIPNNVWAVFGAFGAVWAGFQYGDAPLVMGLFFLFAAFLAIGVYIAWTFFSKYIGGADVKAIMALGLILSPLAYVTTIFGLFFASMVLFGYALVSSKKISLKEMRGFKVPFIPFLLAGLVACFIMVAVA